MNPEWISGWEERGSGDSYLSGTSAEGTIGRSHMPKDQEFPLHLPKMEGRLAAGKVPWSKAGETEGEGQTVSGGLSTGRRKTYLLRPSLLPGMRLREPAGCGGQGIDLKVLKQVIPPHSCLFSMYPLVQSTMNVQNMASDNINSFDLSTFQEFSSQATLLQHVASQKWTAPSPELRGQHLAWKVAQEPRQARVGGIAPPPPYFLSYGLLVLSRL